MIDPHDNTGFSLIEIMISIAIVAIGLFAVMSVLIIVVKGNAHSNKSTTAVTLAQAKLEDFRNMDYDEIIGTYTIYNNPDYYLEITVTPAVGTKTVSVSVYWNPGTSTSVHNVQLKTIFTQ